jgi:long-chain acyl-CoA synthetase
VKIAEADGEVLLKGRGIMRGYHDRPEETRAVLTPVAIPQKLQGGTAWLHTGDIGAIDADGFLKITDRKKDLIKTSGGKYIAPQAIEVQFKAVCPIASQMVVHADRRNYATALIALDPEALDQWGRAHDLPAGDYATLSQRPEVHEYVQGCIEQVNSRLNRWETIKDFRILDRDLSIEGGELTPSLKVKRRVVETTYKSLFDSMYAG